MKTAVSTGREVAETSIRLRILKDIASLPCASVQDDVAETSIRLRILRALIFYKSSTYATRC